MDSDKTQTLLPCECELDILHLDISTYGEAASVAAATRPPDMIFGDNSLHLLLINVVAIQIMSTSWRDGLS